MNKKEYSRQFNAKHNSVAVNRTIWKAFKTYCHQNDFNTVARLESIIQREIKGSASSDTATLIAWLIRAWEHYDNRPTQENFLIVQARERVCTNEGLDVNQLRSHYEKEKAK